MTDDLISRADALEAYADLYWIDERLLNFKTELDKVYDNIRAIPSAQPKQADDLISRADAIDYLFDNMTWFDEDGCETDEDGKRYIITDLVNGIPSAQPKQGEWTVYSEEKPQSVGSYLVTHTTDSGRYYVDYDYWTVFDEFKYHPADVIAWMPFPKPYEPQTEREGE